MLAPDEYLSQKMKPYPWDIINTKIAEAAKANGVGKISPIRFYGYKFCIEEWTDLGWADAIISYLNEQYGCGITSELHAHVTHLFVPTEDKMQKIDLTDADLYHIVIGFFKDEQNDMVHQLSLLNSEVDSEDGYQIYSDEKDRKELIAHYNYLLKDYDIRFLTDDMVQRVMRVLKNMTSETGEIA
jgi:hypothetical protein